MRNPKILKVIATNVCCRRTFCSNLSLQNAHGNFNEDYNNSRIAVSNPQRLLLGLGSSVMSLADPYRAGIELNFFENNIRIDCLTRGSIFNGQVSFRYDCDNG